MCDKKMLFRMARKIFTATHSLFLFLLFMKKKKKRRLDSFNVAKRLQRKLAMQQGFYDGRFKEKIVKDKKRELSRKLSRKKVDVIKEQ